MYSNRNLSTPESLWSNSLYNSNASSVKSHSRPDYRNRTSVSALPSLPDTLAATRSEEAENSGGETAENEEVKELSDLEDTRFVEFDLSLDGNRNRGYSNRSEGLEKRIRAVSVSDDTPTQSDQDLPQQDQDDKETSKQDTEYDEFFNLKSSNWKTMKTIAESDFYDDRGELEFQGTNGISGFRNNFNSEGYTKIDTEEQVAKYAELDKETDFLFRKRRDSCKPNSNIASNEETAGDTDDSEYEDDETLDSDETLQSMKEILSDGEKFAYVGTVKLICVEMATELANIKQSTSNVVAKELSLGQRNFANWTMYIMSKLYSHLSFTKEEQDMIEKLGLHGLAIEDVSESLAKNYKRKMYWKNSKYVEGQGSSLQTSGKDEELDFDLRWAIICDLFLLLLSDGYYDCRSRTLLVQFASHLNVSYLAILQFERRVVESLEFDTNKKSIENKDELLSDRSIIDKYIKKNKKTRMAYIGLATIGGSLAIGLSAGLLAPVIGAGLAAGLSTVGISGTAGFLGGVGGSAIITTGGVMAGAKVGSKAGSRRTGDVHTFEFKPLHNRKRTSLIITVSGWMNGKADDVRLPFSPVDPVMGDVFSLLWEPEMLQSMGQTIGILASEALTTSIQQILGATVLTALMSAIQLPVALSKLSYLLDNPWNVSLDRAWKAGKLLADTLIAGNMGVRPITLVGFSLGARLIYSCLIELAKRGGFGLIENVILLGTPIAVRNDQLGLARSVVSGKFVNGFSRKDWVLGYLFRATSGGILAVAGLSPIESAYGIENIDCTSLVEGHMSYRKAVPKILKSLSWEVVEEEFAEIDEPDPEQTERQRKLIVEFDEARAKMEKEMENESSEKPKWNNFFKTKQKNWWQFRSNGGVTPDQDKDSGKGGQDNEEYDENDPSTAKTNPIFDVNALLNEVNEIETMAHKDEAALSQVRKEVVPKQTNLTINEDTDSST